jgi:hypothetical protein
MWVGEELNAGWWIDTRFVTVEPGVADGSCEAPVAEGIGQEVRLP